MNDIIVMRYVMNSGLHKIMFEIQITIAAKYMLTCM